MKNNSHDALNLPLTPFQMVLVTQAFKPGFLHSALCYFAQRMLGNTSSIYLKRYLTQEFDYLRSEIWLVTGLQRLSSGALRLEQVLPETSSKEPILLFISPGVDPSDELRSLAKRNVGSNFHEVGVWAFIGI